MLMLYTYEITVFDDEFDASYSLTRVIVAETEDDRMELLRHSESCARRSTITRHVLVSARALTVHEVSLLDDAMLTGVRAPLYLTYSSPASPSGSSTYGLQRIHSLEELESLDESVLATRSVWALRREEYEHCSRYRSIRG